MARLKGSKNKPKTPQKISPEDRLRIIANIVIDRILEEQETGGLNRLIKLKK